MDYKEWNEKKEQIADDLARKAARKQGLRRTPDEPRPEQPDEKED